MLVRKLIELLAPAECVGCAHEGAWLCARCLKGSVRPESSCFGCGRAGSPYTCRSCAKTSDLLGISAGALYEDAPRSLVAKLKFDRARSAAVPSAALVMCGLPNGFRADAVTAVPIAPARYRERGFNQSELVARIVARELSVPYVNYLMRTDSRHQVGRDRDERLAGIAGRFKAVRSADGRCLLLIDDVLTTGATLNECATVLRQAGATAVFGGVIARVPGPADLRRRELEAMRAAAKSVGALA